MDPVTHTRKARKLSLANTNMPAKTTEQIRLLQYVFLLFIRFIPLGETGLNYTNRGTSFSIKVCQEAKQLHTLEDAWDGVLFWGFFLCVPLPKG